MATGIADVTGNLILAAMHLGTAVTFTGPEKLLFLSAVRANDDGTDTEWSTSGGYTAGTGFSGLTFGAAATSAHIPTQSSNIAASITSAPAGTWAGCIEVDSSGTPKKLFYYTRTGGNATVNSGDTCNVASAGIVDQLQ